MPPRPDPNDQANRRKAMVKQLPLLTRFYFGAITPLNVEQFSTRELTEYVRFMEESLTATD